MASVTSSQAPQSEPAVAGYSKTARRQYQSCDQCRKSRRACDAGTLRVTSFPLPHDEEPNAPAPTREACSNCARSSKKCTFDWLRSLPLHGLPKGVKRKLELTGLPEPHVAPSDSYGFPSSYTELASLPNAQVAENFTHNQQVGHNNHTWYPKIAPSTKGLPALPDLLHSQTGLSTNTIAPSLQPLGAPGNPTTILPGEEGSQSNPRNLLFNHYDKSISPSSSNSTDSRKGNCRSDSVGGLTSTHSDSSRENDDASVPADKQTKSWAGPTDLSDTAFVDQFSSIGSSSRGPSIGSTQCCNSAGQSSLPLSSGQVRLADKAMKAMVANGLLRIYHDSFENSLSCWVTERNCPYEVELSDLMASSNFRSTAEETAYKLSDNRIFSRVSRLDSAFAPLRGRALTASENGAAQKALNAAVMAFASQWSHGSHNAFWRSKEDKSTTKTWQDRGRNGPPNDPALSAECERMIQKTLWHKARSAIQATAEIDSFKVILAYMLFALTQRPIDEKSKSTQGSPLQPHGDAANARHSSGDNLSGDGTPAQFTDPAMDAMVSEEWNPFYASDLEALVSPPIYLETAVRNLFSWRRRVERYRRMRSQISVDGSIGTVALKDQQTFNILFWLGVMCDTTSSAISKRPLVIPDEDCAMIREKLDSFRPNANSDLHWPGPGADQASGPPEPDGQTGALWGNYLLTFKWAGPRKTPPRWPCCFDEAALVLQEAIPVKVLMFRKVGQLQTLAYRRSAPRTLETCIEEALTVYQHWNATYGQFMIDCVNEHNNLPPHVQSWYVILDGHWHYGCLLLADTIAQIDREEKTMTPQRNLRVICGLITELRRMNSQAIAKIAQASLSEHTPSYPNNPEFHFACNGSAILTEPWTDVLVRAMGSACKVFINWLSIWDKPADPLHNWVVTNTTYDDLYAQAEACIQGMTLLGRKSDAANYTAKVFWTRLSELSHHRRSSDSTEDEKSLAEELVSELSELNRVSRHESLLMAI
ncbi:uncharacterized protein Z518_08768 [Rhinocladiella mackenziei CBS 650.93]|uniref:Zn(2)-C6 fungal-type domain-containing protein n=1 Tax=Rhinocladiella mackenziei CBS 650.93 TaxID=1442369 RepID=A0A0D2J1P9_9EURO|nr:uncharacterized protein Z518_08768 [Rhinocladiella mackenziei CBS 650.93]KIX02825.1 hypothetical protein Z518_08768 [Rhinocladiella mackenziei CBS 650.93]